MKAGRQSPVLPAEAETYLSFGHTSVEAADLSGAQGIHKVILLPAGHEDGHLSDAGGLCGHKGGQSALCLLSSFDWLNKLFQKTVDLEFST